MVHGGKVLELGFSDLIEEAGEVLTLGRREATDIEDRELCRSAFLRATHPPRVLVRWPKTVSRPRLELSQTRGLSQLPRFPRGRATTRWTVHSPPNAWR